MNVVKKQEDGNLVPAKEFFKKKFAERRALFLKKQMKKQQVNV